MKTSDNQRQLDDLSYQLWSCLKNYSSSEEIAKIGPFDIAEQIRFAFSARILLAYFVSLEKIVGNPQPDDFSLVLFSRVLTPVSLMNLQVDPSTYIIDEEERSMFWDKLGYTFSNFASQKRPIVDVLTSSTTIRHFMMHTKLISEIAQLEDKDSVAMRLHVLKATVVSNFLFHVTICPLEPQKAHKLIVTFSQPIGLWIERFYSEVTYLLKKA